MGGNVFGTTAPIKKENIKPTLTEFLKQLGEVFPKATAQLGQMRPLGSVGKKEESGDIDLALDHTAIENERIWGISHKYTQMLFDKFKKRSRTATDTQLRTRAVIVALGEKIAKEKEDFRVDVKASGSGALFMSFPQFNTKGEKMPERVQVDINVGDLNWLSFAYYSSTYKGNIKGLHRTQLMLALFAHKNYVFSHNYGVKQRDTQEIVANSPNEAIKLLNQEYGFNITKEILQDYSKLEEFLKSTLSNLDWVAVHNTYLRILDKTRADIPEDLHKFWIDQQAVLGLTGKFLPQDSNLKKYASK